jgi:hypothetical protein
MNADRHPPDTPYMHTVERNRRGPVVVIARGRFVDYGEVNGLIQAVTAQLADPAVDAVELDASSIEEAGVLLIGAFDALQGLASEVGCELVVTRAAPCLADLLGRTRIRVR